MDLAPRRVEMRIAPALIAAFSLLACADGDPEGDLDEVEVSADDDGKADTTTELKVRTGETSVWMTKQLERRETPDGIVFALRGRASRNVTDGMGFVFDDPYGDFATRTVRTFEVTWPASTLRSLADGVNQFVRLHFTPSSGRPDSLTTRVVVRPRLAGFTGSSSVYLTAELTPVVSGGTVVYRARGSTSSNLAKISVVANGVSLTDVRLTDERHFEFDLAPDQAIAIAGISPISITADLYDRTVEKTATLGFAIKKLGITAGDAYEKWPRPDCEAPVRSCLEALPDGTVDLASCGEAFVVQSCAGRVGVFVDDVAFQAALADGIGRTATPAFRSDAAGLVGAARVEAFAGGTEQTIESRLEPLFGRWYLSATTRGAALTGAVDRAITYAYARPLELVEPTAPVGGNAAVTHQVAGDALLQALTEFDFVNSEFARTLEEIVADNQAGHVASIRAFRETIAIEPHYQNPAWDVLVGNWLSPYVEVAIDRSTGASTAVYIEID
ncbi:MAG TPA: hypothetical protein VIU61_10790 [Kofleriaceae bacterium]